MAEYDRHLLDGEHLGHLISKIKAADATKITDPATKALGNFLKYDGTQWVAANVPDTGVLTVDAATGEKAIVVDNTDPANPRVGFVISATSGNVTLSKASDGLKADVADAALTIAKTTGLQAALDAKANTSSLGTAAAKNFTTSVTAGSNDLVTSGAVATAISSITTFRFEIVQQLPATGETNVIYLVPKSTGPQTNLYIEYAYINNAWEQLGDTQISLEYLTNGEIDQIWSSAT